MLIGDFLDCGLEEETAKCRAGESFCFAGWYVLRNDLEAQNTENCLGDCAELFDYCNQDMIEAKVKLLLQMSLVLIWGTFKFHLYLACPF